MYKKVLVPMALDHGISQHTLEVARALSENGADIIALHVYEMPQGSVSAYLDKSVVAEGFDRARLKLLEKVEGLEGVTPEIVKGHTARTIIDYATSRSIDCIVIGSHQPGLSDYFLGSTASRVVRHAPCAVHVHRGLT
ncbi:MULTISPECIES: universal stress protein [unclassified Ruegeria]|uniref:universal stress protein n=1 Tax=unclassified Ruegeria TaxID=2625375 RepID=UPI0014932651|nr:MULTISPECIES: universal stress protein [unclassified Ruegeria]NOD75367.1 universal stress protein [Ruegeria sp. HKCCD4332]NOD87328.1 universal stress protein [Ruegeria sp. HKCCD4318]NOD91448.1 universal stress protein [Ruegeria sp. HKCCD4884]NOE12883.1 universal stress protein [Ruegeria sp. HKCCD4318-2]NOG08950.1 universal stress protein [Ruegeria sp. HKCCD4315]